MRQRQVYSLTLAAFGVALLLVVSFDRMHTKLLREEERAHLYEHLVQVEDILEARLRHRVEVTSGLAGYIQLHPELSQAEFHSLAEHLAEISGGLIGIHLLKDDRVSHVFPVRHLEVLRDKTIEELYAVGTDGSLVPTPLLQKAVPDKRACSSAGIRFA